MSLVNDKLFDLRKVYHGLTVLTPLDMHGWGSDKPIFKELIDAVSAKLIIEVGTFQGASAAHMAKLAPDAFIVCVDFWANELVVGGGMRQVADDSAFHQFLSNMVHLKLDRQILPLRMDSVTGANTLFFEYYPTEADLIYIDAGHTYEEAAADIKMYYPLLRKGGILFGHDTGMPEVMAAVSDSGYAYRVDGEHWILEAKK